MKVTKDLTEGNIYKNFLIYQIPLLVSVLLADAYSTVDAMIAGKFIHENALGAINSASSYHTLLISLFNGFASGFSIYIAQLFGKREFARLKKEMVNVFEAIAVIAFLFGAISLVFKDQIMDFLKIDEILRPDAEKYFTIYTAGYVFNIMDLLLSTSVCALGVTSFSLYISIGTSTLHILINLFTILVLDMGVEGVAISTVTTKLVGVIIYLVIMKRAFRELESEKVSYRFSFEGLKSSFRYTFPAAVQIAAANGISFLTSPLVNALGATATTGNSVAHQVYNFSATAVWNAARPVTCYVAQCAGKGRYGEIGRGLKTGLILGSIILFPFMIIPMIFADPTVALFFPKGFVGEAYDYALRFVSFYMPILYINMLGHVLHAYIRSLGKMNTVLIITVFTSLTRYLATYILVGPFYVEGAFMAQAIGLVFDAVVSGIVYFRFYHKVDDIRMAIEKTAIAKAKKAKI